MPGRGAGHGKTRRRVCWVRTYRARLAHRSKLIPPNAKPPVEWGPGGVGRRRLRMVDTDVSAHAVRHRKKKPAHASPLGEQCPIPRDPPPGSHGRADGALAIRWGS